LGNLKIRNFALRTRKHVSNVTFYYLSNKNLSNVMKICAKINTVQNINILLIVRSLSLASLKLCS